MGLFDFAKKALGTVLKIGGNAAGAAAGGYISGKSAKAIAEAQIQNQRYINDQNIALTRETNAANEALSREFFDRTMADNWEQIRNADAIQREFAQQGIRWKVEDAKAAGLHPLYALGGGSAASGTTIGTSANLIPHQAPQVEAGPVAPPVEASVLQAMGQSIQSSVARLMDPYQRQIETNTIASMKAATRKDAAIAGYYDSLAAKTAQDAMSAKSFPLPDEGYPVGGFQPVATPLAPYWDSAHGQSVEVLSQRESQPWIQSGTHGFWREYKMSGNTNILLPYSEEGPGEALQNIPVWFLPMVYRMNKEAYGDDWGMKDLRSFLPEKVASDVGRAMLRTPQFGGM